MKRHTFWRSNFSFSSSPLFIRGSTLKGKNLLQEEQILSFQSRPHFQKAMSSMEVNRKSQNFVSIFQKGVKHMAMYPVNLTLLHSDWPKLNRILAVLSATELIQYVTLQYLQTYFDAVNVPIGGFCLILAYSSYIPFLFIDLTCFTKSSILIPPSSHLCKESSYTFEP